MEVYFKFLLLVLGVILLDIKVYYGSDRIIRHGLSTNSSLPYVFLFFDITLTILIKLFIVYKIFAVFF